MLPIVLLCGGVYYYYDFLLLLLQSGQPCGENKGSYPQKQFQGKINLDTN